MGPLSLFPSSSSSSSVWLRDVCVSELCAFSISFSSFIARQKMMKGRERERERERGEGGGGCIRADSAICGCSLFSCVPHNRSKAPTAFPVFKLRFTILSHPPEFSRILQNSPGFT